MLTFIRAGLPDVSSSRTEPDEADADVPLEFAY